jgi:hypothetical protein
MWILVWVGCDVRESGNKEFIIFFVESTLFQVAVPSGFIVRPTGLVLSFVKILVSLAVSEMD